MRILHQDHLLKKLATSGKSIFISNISTRLRCRGTCKLYRSIMIGPFERDGDLLGSQRLSQTANQPLTYSPFSLQTFWCGSILTNKWHVHQGYGTVQGTHKHWHATPHDNGCGPLWACERLWSNQEPPGPHPPRTRSTGSAWQFGVGKWSMCPLKSSWYWSSSGCDAGSMGSTGAPWGSCVNDQLCGSKTMIYKGPKFNHCSHKHAVRSRLLAKFRTGLLPIQYIVWHRAHVDCVH